jgi:predicted MFS family arabinose efflux permease
MSKGSFNAPQESSTALANGKPQAGNRKSPMFRSPKPGYFVLTWLHIYAAAYYANYLFFHLRQDYGFANRENLLYAAIIGLIYIPGSWYGGKFAQRRGYFTALKVGFGVMAVVLAAGTVLSGLMAETIIMAAWTVAICFTWAPLEALASHGEDRPGLARVIGIYNVVWSSGAAVAYFTGGALQQALGSASLYWLPASIHTVQFALLLQLERRSRSSPPTLVSCAPRHLQGLTEEPEFAQHRVSPEIAKAFLRMAWLANPFAYVAMNTVVPLIPDLAARFGLSTKLAGFTASVWMFARLGAFALLWRWTAWHYRFGWLLASYVVMVVTFAALFLIRNLAVVVLAQIGLGLAVGLIYYSSLFYSMDVGSETQGEHGGYHETLIGVGIFLGPAAGAAAAQFAPTVPRASIWAVSAVLLVGGIALVALWRRRDVTHP